MVDEFDERFDEFWRELVKQNGGKLLAERTSRALSWHFAIPNQTNRLRVFTSCRNRMLRAYCIVIFGGDGNHAHLIDYQTIEREIDCFPGYWQQFCTNVLRKVPARYNISGAASQRCERLMTLHLIT